MNNIYRKITVFIVILFVAAAFVFAFMPEREMESEQNPDELPGQEMKDIQLTLYNTDHSVRWELTAGEGRESGNSLNLDPLSVRVLREEDDKLLYSLAARGGDYREDEGKLYIEGPVDIDRGDYHFRTGDLVWDQEKDLIRGEEEVVVESSSLEVTGQGLEADSGFEWAAVDGSKEKQANLRWGDRDEKN
ncbi:MAG: LPS export ABC transporter periplasmic protein LptC [Bacillota bacterium]